MRTRASVLVAGCLLVISFLLIACGGGDKSGGPSGGSAPGASAGCGPSGSRIASVPRKGEREFKAPPERVIDPAKSYAATVKTSKGNIVMSLAAAEAPNTVNNFVFLACDGYFDGLNFHRYVAGFVIQGGDPKGDGSGGPGYSFADEISPRLRHDAPGVVAMANAGPNTNGSQFYVTLSPQLALDGKYNIFGRVTGGIDVVNAIRAGDKIVSVSVEEK